MTPIEKAEAALNTRIERLQINLREAKSDAAQRFLFQSLVVCIGVGDALSDYVKMIGQFAQGRHAELKRTHDTLTAQHAELLKSGNELLQLFKANPTDKAIRKDIDAAQQAMATIQKTLRRGANALQRDIAPSMAMIDKIALSVRRFGEADQTDALKRVIKMIVEQARDLYQTQPSLPTKNIVDAAAWENSANAEIDQAISPAEAYARAGYQVMLALEVMTLAVSPSPPHTTEEAVKSANDSVTKRFRSITARFRSG